MAERLWEQLQIEKQYSEDQPWSYGANRSEATPMSEEWDRNHAGITPKRKNAKRPKKITELTDKQKHRKGLALEPTPMEFDVEQTEAELEQKLMEQAAAQRIEEGQFLQGRRITGRKKADPNQSQKKSFWV